MKEHYLTIILLLICFYSQAQIVEIPDANFKNTLLYDIVVDTDGNGIPDSYADTNHDGEIQVSEAESIITLIVNDKNIISLEGIQSFINIEVLYCQYNKITNLNFSENPELIKLKCQYNEITDLNITNNLKLEYLYCSENLIANIDLSHNIDLLTLICGDNPLNNLDLYNNINLTGLYCYMNQLTNLNISQNLNLTHLYCPVNQLTSLDVSQNQNLDLLHFSDNQLTVIDVSQNSNLEELLFQNNQISNIDVTQNFNLEVFWCFNNQITNLNVSQNSSLKNLRCHDNFLSSLDLSQNPALMWVYCYNTQLTNLNIKNGNNSNIETMLAFDNPNLICIQVDDENATYPICDLNIPYNGWCKDNWAAYNENCNLGIEDYLQNSFTIFPNPTQDILFIESHHPIENVKVYNLQGQLIKEVLSKIVDVSQLTNGLYFVQVAYEGKSVTKKFIKE